MNSSRNNILFLLIGLMLLGLLSGCNETKEEKVYSADEIAAMDKDTRATLKSAIIASIREDASKARNYRDLATIHQVEGDKIEAIKNLRDFVRNSRDDYAKAQAYYEISVLIDLLEQVDDRQEQFIQCLENAWIFGSGGPQGNILLIELGKGYSRIDRPDDAIKCFELGAERIGEKPRRIEAMMELAEMYAEKQRIQDAVQVFRDVIAELPDPDTKKQADTRINQLVTE